MILTVIKWFLIIGVICIFIIAVALRFVDFSASQEEIDKAFSGLDYAPEFKKTKVDDRNIFYMTIGDTSNQTILFVHGSPGSWSDHRFIFTDPTLLKSFRFISIDRPGFGGSGVGEPERSLEKQAQAVSGVLKKEHTSAIVVGHSYGGPVVVKAAIDSPENIDGVIIVAGSVAPELEKTRWYQILVHYKILSWILPRDIYSTNEEILALKKELELLESEWSNVTQPVSIIQGGKDVLVPAANANYAVEKLTNADVELLMIPEMNHFVPWSNPELIKQEILRIGKLIHQKKSPNE